MSDGIPGDMIEEQACSGSTGAACYVVVARESYEPDIIISIYTDKTAAGTFCKICEKYQATYLPYPSSDDQAECDEWESHNKRWQAKHPAAGNCSFFGNEEFTIIESVIYT